jgi:hypothetical protein
MKMSEMKVHPGICMKIQEGEKKQGWGTQSDVLYSNINRLVLLKFRAGHEVSASRTNHLAAPGFQPAGTDRAKLVGEFGGYLGVHGIRGWGV